MNDLQSEIAALADEAIRKGLLTLGGELSIVATAGLDEPTVCLDMGQRLRALRQATTDDPSRVILRRALNVLGVSP